MTVHNVPGVLEGEIDALIDALVMADQADRLRDVSTRGRLTEAVTEPTGRDPPVAALAARSAVERLTAVRVRRRRASTPSCCWRTAHRRRTGSRSWPTRRRRSEPTPRRAFEAAIGPAGAGEPVAYIRGLQEFHGLAFATDARALIPRPETELARRARARGRHAPARRAGRGRTGAPPLRIADVGTGSGRDRRRADRRRCGGVGMADEVVAGRSRPTSPPMRSSWPARTRSATRSRTGCPSRKPTCCPNGRAAVRRDLRQPAVRGDRDELPGLAEATSFEPVRGARRRSGRPGRHRSARCDRLPEVARADRGRRCSRSAPTRARPSRPPWRTACPGWRMLGRGGPGWAATRRSDRSPESDRGPGHMTIEIPDRVAPSFPIRLIALDIDGTLVG